MKPSLLLFITFLVFGSLSFAEAISEDVTDVINKAELDNVHDGNERIRSFYKLNRAKITWDEALNLAEALRTDNSPYYTDKYKNSYAQMNKITNEILQSFVVDHFSTLKPSDIIPVIDGIPYQDANKLIELYFNFQGNKLQWDEIVQLTEALRVSHAPHFYGERIYSERKRLNQKLKMLESIVIDRERPVTPEEISKVAMKLNWERGNELINTYVKFRGGDLDLSGTEILSQSLQYSRTPYYTDSGKRSREQVHALRTKFLNGVICNKKLDVVGNNMQPVVAQ